MKTLEQNLITKHKPMALIFDQTSFKRNLPQVPIIISPLKKLNLKNVSGNSLYKYYSDYCKNRNQPKKIPLFKEEISLPKSI
jgi:hypothetical protein